MSLITRCPACGTMFKVVPDQLRISEGWVRCGHCAEVFDATDFLHGEQAPAAAAPVHAAVSRREAVAVDAGESEGFSSSLQTESGESGNLLSEEPDSVLLAAAAEALKENPLDRPFEFRREDRAPAEEIEREEPLRTSPAPVLEPEPELDDLSFVQQARRREFWSQPAVRALMVVALLFLGALLAAQVALQDRDRLAAADPTLRPWLAALCEPLHCRIGPPRQIDAISIDSSSFNKLRPDAFRLNVTLKNQATTPVAMPALELTLTDSQDQALLRRVVMPSEMGLNAAAIPAASEWSGSLGLTVSASEASSRVAGYRVLAFYP